MPRSEARVFFRITLFSKKVIPMRKKVYRAVALRNVNLPELLARLPEGPVSMGVDVAKEELFVTLRDASEAFQRPWKVKQPSEIGLLVEQLQLLSQHHPLMVSMESTGTYGDCLRQAPDGCRFGASSRKRQGREGLFGNI